MRKKLESGWSQAAGIESNGRNGVKVGRMDSALNGPWQADGCWVQEVDIFHAKPLPNSTQDHA